MNNYIQFNKTCFNILGGDSNDEYDPWRSNCKTIYYISQRTRAEFVHESGTGALFEGSHNHL